MSNEQRRMKNEKWHVSHSISSWFNLILQNHAHTADPPFPESVQLEVFYEREIVSWQSLLVQVHNRPKSFLHHELNLSHCHVRCDLLFSGVPVPVPDHVKHWPYFRTPFYAAP